MREAYFYLYVRVFKPLYLDKKNRNRNKKKHIFNIKDTTLRSHHYDI